MKVTIVAAISIFMAGCATQSQLEKALSTDGAIVDKSTIELIGDQGYTAKAVSGNWVAFLSPDGRKVVRVNDEHKELTWRVNDNGEFCEELYSQGGEEVCGDRNVRVINSDGTYRNFVNGKSDNAGSYKILAGNSENL